MFEDRMSLDILQDHLEDFKQQYIESKDNRALLPHSPWFLPVYEIVRKIGLESQMLTLIAHTRTGITSSRGLDDQKSKYDDDISRSDCRNLCPQESMKLNEISFDNGNYPEEYIEYKDNFYVDEGHEVLLEVNRFNRLGERTPEMESHHTQSFESIDAQGIVNRNMTFLESEAIDRSHEGDHLFPSTCTPRQSDDSSQEEEHPSKYSLGVMRSWVIDFLDQNPFRDWANTKLKSALYDFFLHGLFTAREAKLPTFQLTPSRETLPLPQPKGKKQPQIQKLAKEDYYYKLDEESVQKILERKRASREAGKADGLTDSDPIKPVETFNNTPLLSHTMDQHELEKLNNSGQELEYLLPGINDKKTLGEDDPKGKGKQNKKTKKGKKPTTQVVVDKEGSEFTSIFGKTKKSKQKKDQKQPQKQQVKSKNAKDDIQIDGVSVSVIPNGSDNSIINENDEIISDFIGQEQANDGGMLISDTAGAIEDQNNPQDGSREEDTSPVNHSPTPVESDIRLVKAAVSTPQEAEHQIDSPADKSVDGKDKKKKKKKPKKPAVTKPGQAKEAPLEELSQIDKEKDSAIAEIDNILKRNDNLVLSILEVLDNNFMSEEFYVDKRRHFSKYVYISDSSNANNNKGGK